MDTVYILLIDLWPTFIIICTSHFLSIAYDCLNYETVFKYLSK